MCQRFLVLQISIAVLLAACSQDPEVEFASEIRVKEHLTIGLEEHENDILGGVRAILADSERNIFIADPTIPAIRVFDSSGRWKSDIGQLGEGPVEFASLHTIEKIKGDTLLAVDGAAMRATAISADEGYLDSWPLVTVKNGFLMPWSMHPLGDGRFLVQGEHVISTNPLDDHPLYMFHIVSREQSGYRILESFFDRKDALGHSDFGLAWPSNGSIAQLDEHSFLYSPQLYEGQLYFIHYNQKNDSWEKVDRWEGVVKSDESYELVTEDDYPGHNVTLAGSPSGTFFARIFNRSSGLFYVENDKILHFTRIRVNGKEQFGIETFNLSGELINYGRIYTRDYPEEPSSNPHVDYLDKHGRFYVRDEEFSTGAPIVRVIELKNSKRE